MTRSHAPGVRWRLTGNICPERPLHAASLNGHRGGGLAGAPNPHTPNWFAFVYFLGFENTCLDLLIMMKAEDKERKTEVGTKKQDE